MSEEFYKKDDKTALEAQRIAQEIAFGPVTFQVARLMRDFGILDALVEAKELGLSLADICEKLGKTKYVIQVLLESGLSSGLVYLKGQKFSITKTGLFILNDEMTRINMNFIHDVCYKGLFHLEEALKEETPAGLKELGEWPTVYEGLSELEPQVQKSWFAYDHFYSDCSFKQALEIVFSNKPKTLLDVGGNTGRWAVQCVTHDNDVEVTIMDLPQQIDLMKEAIKELDGKDRIKGHGANLLDRNVPFPGSFDAIWMSQFLDCFSEEEVKSILSRASASMNENSTLYIMETYWDRQKFETASYVLNQTSVYFTAIANGNSKFYHSKDMENCGIEAGLKVTKIHDYLGLGHTIMELKRC